MATIVRYSSGQKKFPFSLHRTSTEHILNVSEMLRKAITVLTNMLQKAKGNTKKPFKTIVC